MTTCRDDARRVPYVPDYPGVTQRRGCGVYRVWPIRYALERTPTGPVTPAEDFDEFVRATGTRLLRTAVLLCGDPHLAEDLTQTTYAKVYVNWRRVTRADNPVAYTRSVLVRTYLSHRRRRSTSEMPIETLPETPGTADDTALRMDLLAALAQLAPADRAVLVLRYWEDLSRGPDRRPARHQGNHLSGPRRTRAGPAPHPPSRPGGLTCTCTST